MGHDDPQENPLLVPDPYQYDFFIVLQESKTIFSQNCRTQLHWEYACVGRGREWLCLYALEGTCCLQPQLSKSVELCLPPGHAKQQSPVQMFSEELAEKLWRSKKEDTK